MISFEVYGKVVGKQRPRFSRNGGTYTPKPTKDYEKLIRNSVERTAQPFGGEVYVKVDTYRALPKSSPKKVSQESDVLTPDADNIGKTVLDALNGVLYNDDKQVVDLRVVKHPRTRCDEHIRIEVGETHID